MARRVSTTGYIPRRSRPALRRRTIPTLLGAWLTVLVGEAAYADPAAAPAATPQATTAPAEANPEALAPVVVSGERRNSTVQKTPISITAVSGAELEDHGITDVARLAAQIPGVSLESEGPGRTSFEMRGLSNSGGSSPTVGFYLDDVPISPPSSPLAAAGKTEIDPDLYDLERVEVLRGPQGTLYGSGSMGGTIRLITNQPSLTDYEGSALAGVSSTHGGGVNYTTNAMLNVPVSDTLALRLVLTDKYDSGFINRVVVSPFPVPNADGTRGNVTQAPVVRTYTDDNDDRIQVARLTALYQPTPDLTITPSIFIQDLTTGMLSSFDSNPGTLNHYQPFDSPESSSQNFQLYKLGIKYRMAHVELESVTSVLHETTGAVEDDAEALFVAFGPTTTGYPAGVFSTETHVSNQFNQEIRLSSNDPASPLQWVSGLFISSFRDDTVYNDVAPGYASVYGTGSIFQYNEPDQIVQRALFGEINDQVSHDWKATLGVRLYNYTFSYNQTESGLASGIPYSSGSASASGVSPKATLTYTPTDDALMYGTVGRGFRPGGPNTPIPVSPGGAVNCTGALNSVGLSAEPATYEPDTVTNFELGSKLRLLDGRVTVNGAVYYMDWDHIQQQVTLSCGYNFSANAGKAVSKGGEIEVNAKLAPGLLWQQNAGYTRAYLTSIDVPGNSPLGQQLPDVPQWTYATQFIYSAQLSGGERLNASVSERFVGSEYDYSGVPAAFTEKPSYRVTDARLRVSRDAWSASAFIDNIFNAEGIVGIQRSEALNITETARLIPIRPRTIGVDLSYRF